MDIVVSRRSFVQALGAAGLGSFLVLEELAGGKVRVANAKDLPDDYKKELQQAAATGVSANPSIYVINTNEIAICARDAVDQSQVFPGVSVTLKALANGKSQTIVTDEKFGIAVFDLTKLDLEETKNEVFGSYSFLGTLLMEKEGFRTIDSGKIYFLGGDVDNFYIQATDPGKTDKYLRRVTFCDYDVVYRDATFGVGHKDGGPAYDNDKPATLMAVLQNVDGTKEAASPTMSLVANCGDKWSLELKPLAKDEQCSEYAAYAFTEPVLSYQKYGSKVCEPDDVVTLTVYEGTSSNRKELYHTYLNHLKFVVNRGLYLMSESSAADSNTDPELDFFECAKDLSENSGRVEWAFPDENITHIGPLIPQEVPFLGGSQFDFWSPSMPLKIMWVAPAELMVGVGFSTKAFKKDFKDKDDPSGHWFPDEEKLTAKQQLDKYFDKFAKSLETIADEYGYGSDTEPPTLNVGHSNMVKTWDIVFSGNALLHGGYDLEEHEKTGRNLWKFRFQMGLGAEATFHFSTPIAGCPFPLFFDVLFDAHIKATLGVNLARMVDYLVEAGHDTDAKETIEKAFGLLHPDANPASITFSFDALIFAGVGAGIAGFLAVTLGVAGSLSYQLQLIDPEEAMVKDPKVISDDPWCHHKVSLGFALQLKWTVFFVTGTVDLLKWDWYLIGNYDWEVKEFKKNLAKNHPWVKQTLFTPFTGKSNANEDLCATSLDDDRVTEAMAEALFTDFNDITSNATREELLANYYRAWAVMSTPITRDQVEAVSEMSLAASNDESMLCSGYYHDPDDEEYPYKPLVGSMAWDEYAQVEEPEPEPEPEPETIEDDPEEPKESGSDAEPETPEAPEGEGESEDEGTESDESDESSESENAEGEGAKVAAAAMAGSAVVTKSAGEDVPDVPQTEDEEEEDKPASKKGGKSKAKAATMEGEADAGESKDKTPKHRVGIVYRDPSAANGNGNGEDEGILSANRMKALAMTAALKAVDHRRDCDESDPIDYGPNLVHDISEYGVKPTRDDLLFGNVSSDTRITVLDLKPVKESGGEYGQAVFMFRLASCDGRVLLTHSKFDAEEGTWGNPVPLPIAYGPEDQKIEWKNGEGTLGSRDEYEDYDYEIYSSGNGDFTCVLLSTKRSDSSAGNGDDGALKKNAAWSHAITMMGKVDEATGELKLTAYQVVKETVDKDLGIVFPTINGETDKHRQAFVAVDLQSGFTEIFAGLWDKDNNPYHELMWVYGHRRVQVDDDSLALGLMDASGCVVSTVEKEVKPTTTKFEQYILFTYGVSNRKKEKVKRHLLIRATIDVTKLPNMEKTVTFAQEDLPANFNCTGTIAKPLVSGNSSLLYRNGTSDGPRLFKLDLSDGAQSKGVDVGPIGANEKKLDWNVDNFALSPSGTTLFFASNRPDDRPEGQVQEVEKLYQMKGARKMGSCYSQVFALAQLEHQVDSMAFIDLGTSMAFVYRTVSDQDANVADVRMAVVPVIMAMKIKQAYCNPAAVCKGGTGHLYLRVMNVGNCCLNGFDVTIKKKGDGDESRIYTIHVDAGAEKSNAVSNGDGVSAYRIDGMQQLYYDPSVVRTSVNWDESDSDVSGNGGDNDSTAYVSADDLRSLRSAAQEAGVIVPGVEESFVIDFPIPTEGWDKDTELQVFLSGFTAPLTSNDTDYVVEGRNGQYHDFAEDDLFALFEAANSEIVQLDDNKKTSIQLIETELDSPALPNPADYIYPGDPDPGPQPDPQPDPDPDPKPKPDSGSDSDDSGSKGGSTGIIPATGAEVGPIGLVAGALGVGAAALAAYSARRTAIERGDYDDEE